MPSFSIQSATRLFTCHHDLQRLFHEVIKYVDCTVLCGHRGKDEQDLAFATGHSRQPWPHSKHNLTPSLAVDVAPCPVNWQDQLAFDHFAAVTKEVASRLGIKVVWGGDWKGFRDMPHWQIGE